MSQPSKYRSWFLNNYDRHTFISRGGFGSVFRCREKPANQTENSRVVAIKVVEFDENEFATVHEEVKLLQSVNHRNIIRLTHAWVETPEVGFSYGYFKRKRSCLLFIEMEICPLGSLRRWILAEWRNQHQGRFFVYRIVKAVSYLHSQRICHRDLKLGNLLLQVENDQVIPKVCDFGLATKYLNRMNGICGTVGYQAPEMLNGEDYDERIDVFSLGVLFTELLVYGDKGNMEISMKVDENMKNPGSDYNSSLLQTFGNSISVKEKELIGRMTGIKKERPTAKEVRNKLKEIVPGIEKDSLLYSHVNGNEKKDEGNKRKKDSSRQSSKKK